MHSMKQRNGICVDNPGMRAKSDRQLNINAAIVKRACIDNARNIFNDRANEIFAFRS